jgi:hypothetical protein
MCDVVIAHVGPQAGDTMQQVPLRKLHESRSISALSQSDGVEYGLVRWQAVNLGVAYMEISPHNYTTRTWVDTLNFRPARQADCACYSGPSATLPRILPRYAGPTLTRVQLLLRSPSTCFAKHHFNHCPYS